MAERVATGEAAETLPPLSREIAAGLTTFVTVAYIVVVNPAILSTHGTGIPFSGALTATVLVCFTMTLLMGLYAKLPYAVAPGMGINAFFTYSLVLGKQIPWPVALGMVFWAGVIFLIISVTPLREHIARSIPHNLRVGAAVGIGVFLTFIGLKNAGIVVADPVTFVKLGTLGPAALLCLVGLVLTVALMRRNSPWAFLVGIVGVTGVAWAFDLVDPPKQLVAMPDFSSVFLALDVKGALALALIPATISIMFTDLFDSISTFVGVSRAGNLLDADGHPKNLRQGLIVDSFATLGAGLFGSSSGTAYIESVAGIQMGGRSGRVAVVTALCFLPCFFIAPIAGAIPAFATAPVLILVGSLMFRGVRELHLDHLEDAVPAFLTVVLIPLTFSITLGILWGFLSHVGLYAIAGRRRELSPTLWALAALSAVLLWLEHGV